MALASAITPQGDPTQSSSEAKPSLRILVVEDDPFTLTILQKRLALGGYAVATATNGRQGLEKLEEFQPDLIISDWMMPEMDGCEFCSRVKNHPLGQTIYFILLTAKDKYEDKVSALDLGADEYLVKPCDSGELLARLRAAERILRLQRELSQSNNQLHLALKRINAELEAASRIQRRLLPQSLPEVPGYGFAAHYQPSTECGGDFYEVLALADGRLGIVIGDVSGHGTPAMVAMSVIHLLLHQEAALSTDPAGMLHQLNDKVYEFLPTDQYATMFYGILDPASGQLIYSSAGHNPPLKADPPKRQFDFLEGCEGFPIKLIGPNMEYKNQRTVLTPGQHLILYTDGLLEADNDQHQMFGSQRLIESISTVEGLAPQKILEKLLSDLNQYVKGQPLEDDLSLLILSRY